MTITIEKTETIKSEIEITLPYYSKYGKLFYYKVISETIMLKVTSPFDDQPNTELTKYCIDSAFRDGTEQIEYSEFKEALITATQKIVNS
jgi:hypothetical protein